MVFDMTEGIDHIGIATNSLDAHSEFWSSLGFIQGKDELNEEQGVKIRFFQPVSGGPKIELLEPLTPDSPIGKFLARNPDGGMHHICFDVEDLAAMRDKMIEEGARVLGDGTPKIGAHGKPVLFFHPKDFNGTLIELEQI